MVSFTVVYPYREGMRFDMDYYLEKHIGMIKEKVGEVLKGVTVERGLTGPTPDSTPGYAVIARLLFETAEDIAHFMAPHSPVFQADIPNFTDVSPSIQINEVLV